MGRERRKFERIDSLLSIRYGSKKGEIRGYSLTKDCSEGGVGMPLAGKVPKGAELDLAIILHEDGKTTIPATARVVWSKRNPEHWKPRYSSGLRFVDIDPGDKERVLGYAKRHQWVKSDFERALEDDKVPVLGRRRDF